MDVLPLPARPNLEQYRKRAKDLAKAARSADPGAVRAWAADWLNALARSRPEPITAFVQASIDRVIDSLERHIREKLSKADAGSDSGHLAEAQFLVARAHGFESWPKFSTHVERMGRSDSDIGEFETAADAVVTGDLPALESFLRTNPALTREHSTRSHHATLLHYVAANGVEDFRQKSPPNAVAIAKVLLDAGAEVDALADTYGGDRYQTTMNLLVSSTHPADAGVQAALVDTLVDFGAAVNGLDDDSSPLMTALAFGYRDAAEALARRGARLDSIIAAAAMGRLDLIRSFVVDRQTLRPNVRLIGPAWFGLPNDPKTHIELACVWAAKFGRTEVVDYLLAIGVPATIADTDHMTLLHWAAANCCVDLVKRLIERGVPLEAENTWGGTVLNSTLHFALYQPAPGATYLPVLEMLIAAGADIREVTPFPTGDASIDNLLRRHGAAASE
jgi:ankyrin repeat protein